MKTEETIKLIKYVTGSVAAVLLAAALQLQFAYAAGIITLLTIQDTKKETVRITAKRMIIFVIMTLGCALSMNNIGIGFSASITGLPFLPASVSTFFCSFGFLAFGSRLGRSAFLQQIGEYTDPVSGLLLILLGLCQLYH